MLETIDENYYKIYYYGKLLEIDGEKYIVNTDTAPVKVVGLNPLNNEEIVFFDGAYQGYDNLFCENYDKDEIANRTLVRYDIPLVKVHIYKNDGIDYEDEKEQYNIDDKDFVSLYNGDKMLWEDLKVNGFDFISIIGITDNNEQINILDLELA